MIFPTVTTRDMRETAEHLFNVHLHQVTPKMIAQLHITIYPGVPPEDPNWIDCPDCKQSATGKYLGIPACSRCGWSLNGSRTKRGGLFS